MTETAKIKSRPDEEVWESCVRGRTWVEITDHRGAPKNISVVGVGSRLRITTMDRIRNQEIVRDPQGDPFVNGMLMRVDADQKADPTTASGQVHSDEDLKMVFTLEDDAFEAYVKELNQLNVRRLKELAPVHASVKQDKFLEQQLAERWPIGGSVPSWEEMQSSPM